MTLFQGTLKMEKANQKNKNLVSYSIIVAAVSGNVEAINEVLDHYSGYIKKISTSDIKDEDGHRRRIVDAYLSGILEIHLITAILKFDISRYR